MTEDVIMVPLWVPVIIGIIVFFLGAFFHVWLNNFLSADDCKVIHRKGKTLKGIRFNYLVLYKGNEPGAGASYWNVEEGPEGNLVVVGPTDPAVINVVEEEDRDLRIKQVSATIASGRGEMML